MKSENGVEYRFIGSVNGKGTTTQTSHYSFIDRFAGKGICYYKLIQIDFDGTENILGPTSTKGCSDNFELNLLLLSSNAASSDFLLSAPLEGAYLFRIFSNDGKTIMTQNFTCNEGANLLKVKTGSLPAGLYLVEVFNRNLHFSKRFLLGLDR